MTIKLLAPRDLTIGGRTVTYPAGAIVTLDSATETGLVGTKEATTDLTGGITYTPPVPSGQPRDLQVLTSSDGVVALINPATGDTLTSPCPIIFQGRKDTDTVFTGLTIAPWVVTDYCDLTAVRGYCAVSQAAKVMEVVVYNEKMAKVASSGQIEIPAVGIFEIAIPKTRLAPGTYYAGIMTNATTASFGTVSNVKGFLRTSLVPPSLANISTLVPTRVVPALEPICGDLPMPDSIGPLLDSPINVLGGDSTVGVWGYNTATGKLCKSTDGLAFTDLMLPPTVPGGYVIDLIVSGTKLYVLSSRMTCFVSSDLSASATWSDITPPKATAPGVGLLHSVAQARPYCITVWQDYFWLGEYTTTPTGEVKDDPFDPSGPRLLKYGPLSGTPAWSLGKQFDQARHLHGLVNAASTIMFVICGDNNINGVTYGDGSALGYWRVTSSDISVFTKWSLNNGLYPVDAIYVSGYSTSAEMPDGLYGSADQNGSHVNFCKISGNAGGFVINKQCFTPSGGGSETARGLVLEGATKNIYYHTAETTLPNTPAIYVTPPPGIRPFKLYSVPDIKLDARAVVAYGRVFHYNYHHDVVRFPHQRGL